MHERDVESHLVKRVKELGGEVRKVEWIGRNGAPDRFVMLPTGCCWVELKAPGQKPKPHQQREHERMRAKGQIVLVLDSVEAVEEWFV